LNFWFCFVIVVSVLFIFIQEGFAQTATLGVSGQSKCGFEPTLKRNSAYTMPVQWIWSGFEAKVSIADACAVD